MLIPANLSQQRNADLAARRLSEMINVTLREDIFNFGNLMRPPPLGGMAKVSLTIEAAEPTTEGVEQVLITASATYIYR